MRIWSPANTGTISCPGESLEWVTAFIYLGSLIFTTGGTEEDVEARCRKAQTIWKSKFVSLWTKLRIFDSNVKMDLRPGD